MTWAEIFFGLRLSAELSYWGVQPILWSRFQIIILGVVVIVAAISAPYKPQYCFGSPLNLYLSTSNIFDESVHEIKPSFSDHVDCIEKQMIGATEGSAVKVWIACWLIPTHHQREHRVEMKDGKRRQQLNYTEKRDLEDDFMSSIVAEMRKKNTKSKLCHNCI